MAQPQQRPAQGVVRFYNFLVQGNSFLDDALKGMAQAQKSLPSKYLYDRRGCALFEKVCELPDYYLDRSELAILREHAGAMAKFLGADCQLIEFGAGLCRRTQILIEQLQPPLYVLIDIDGEAMQATADGLAQQFPWLNTIGVRADDARALKLPEFVGIPIRKKAAYFPGAKLSHFSPDEAIALLKCARRMVGTGGALLATVDLKKDTALLEAACNDAAGVIAAFNLNLLARINRELGADFQLRRFGYKGLYDAHKGRTQMQIESLAAQFVHVDGARFRFGQGETIHTEISCKYSVEEFQALAHRAGFAPDQIWTDAEGLFSMHGMIAI